MPDNGTTARTDTFATPRHLAVVLLQLGQVRDRREHADQRLAAMDHDDPDREAQEERFGRAEGDILNLEREARGMIASATGVPWDLIEEAGL